MDFSKQPGIREANHVECDHFQKIPHAIKARNLKAPRSAIGLKIFEIM
jgi:hypothetical protein